MMTSSVTCSGEISALIMKNIRRAEASTCVRIAETIRLFHFPALPSAILLRFWQGPGQLVSSEGKPSR